MEQDTTTLKDIDEHQADLHFFLGMDTKDSEDCMMRFARTFGSEKQFRETQGWVMTRRIERRTK